MTSLNKSSKVNAVVTTTINPPGDAIHRFIEMGEEDGFPVIVVGDTKTPHEEYKKLNCTYLHPEMQEQMYPELSEVLGWRSIQRRNIGFIEAYKLTGGEGFIATIDDDNIPYDNWGKLFFGELAENYSSAELRLVSDPLAVFTDMDVWHRGFPIQLLDAREEHRPECNGFVPTDTCLVQANLWDGDPDIDAVARIALAPDVEFEEGILPYCMDSRYVPFNSQNTILKAEIIPYYAVLPFIGRMDDIWGGYILQHRVGTKRPCVMFAEASVFQERNPHDLAVDLDREIIGYRHTFSFLNGMSNYKSYLPDRTNLFLSLYEKEYEKLGFKYA